jgi:hypothetical protein
MMELKRIPGTCCPEPTCDHEKVVDGMSCKSCGSACASCHRHRGDTEEKTEFGGNSEPTKADKYDIPNQFPPINCFESPMFNSMVEPGAGAKGAELARPYPGVPAVRVSAGSSPLMLIEEPCKVKLERNSKGYTWELSCLGPDLEKCIKEVDNANFIMESKFGGRKH